MKKSSQTRYLYQEGDLCRLPRTISFNRKFTPGETCDGHTISTFYDGKVKQMQLMCDQMHLPWTS